MENMFYYTGTEAASFTLDLDKFITEKVTNMSNMFYYTGSNSLDFRLDVSNFDTKNVTNMKSMFVNTGSNSKVFNFINPLGIVRFCVFVSKLPISKPTISVDFIRNSSLFYFV